MLQGVEFGPDDVKAVANGIGTRAQIFALFTSQTCGEACWHAKEEICRCSCGGKNHGCLKTADGIAPVRMAKIDGHRYKLAGVGYELRAEARQINRLAGWKAIDRPSLVIDSTGTRSDDIVGDLAKALAAGHDAWISQYHYHWDDTDCGAPARIKYASKDQIARWSELTAYRDCEAWKKPLLLWVREVMPEAPKQLMLDSKTGLPLADQLPPE